MPATVARSPRSEILLEAVAPRIARLAGHPVWGTLRDRGGLVRFMESHVYCVWDFMSLLESLRMLTSGAGVPWRPVGDAKVRRLVHEIVVAEGSDRLPDGRVASHFELYLAAMEEAGVATTVVRRLLEVLPGRIEPGGAASAVRVAAATAGVPAAAADFMASTFAVIDRGRPWEIAAAFGIGREQAIPDMFAATLAALGRESRCVLFAEYLERHVELDGEEHGPMMLELIAALCGEDDSRWHGARAAALDALDARERLWDAIAGPD
ncbi:MAG: DUF3050 domain-containing protein [Planctomycetaceae bacterium]